jgi:hypothetical protein
MKLISFLLKKFQELSCQTTYSINMKNINFWEIHLSTPVEKQYMHKHIPREQIPFFSLVRITLTSSARTRCFNLQSLIGAFAHHIILVSYGAIAFKKALDVLLPP